MLKKCFKCKAEKDIGEFYKHKQMTDGHLNKCKECAKLDVRQNYQENKPAKQAYDKRRNMLPHRVAARSDYQKTEAGKEAKRRAHKAYAERYPAKRAAHHVIGNAIRDGKLIRPDHCEACGGGGKTDAHHPDYTKPLEVEWLCRPCHLEWHRNNDPIY